MDILKETDLTEIQVGGKKYNVGFSRNNYDDDEKEMVHAAKPATQSDLEMADLRAEMKRKDDILQRYIDDTNTKVDSNKAETDNLINSNKADADKNFLSVRADMQQQGASLSGEIAGESDARGEADTLLQNQINKIVAKNASVSVAVSPLVIYKGVSTPITITASVSGIDVENKGETNISIMQGGTVLQTATGAFSVTHTKNITEQTTFTGVADYRGLKIGNGRTVYAEHPIYVGSGKTYAEVAVEKFKQVPKTSPSGDYNIKPADGDNVFMIVPSNMSISGVNLGVLNYPYKQDANQMIGGVTYKVYSSVEKTSNKPFTITIK